MIDSRASSLRDAPVAEISFGPRARTSIAIEPGLYRFDFARSKLILGGFGGVQLENVVQRDVFPPNELWRGLVGVTAAWAFDRTFEIAASLGHESVHIDSVFPAYSRELSALERATPPAFVVSGLDPDVIDYVGFDLALRRRVGDLVLTAYARERIALAGIVNHQPAAEVGARYGHGWLVPTLTTSGETVVGGTAIAPVLRVLAGLGLRARAGEVMPFVTFESGYGRGYLLNTRDTKLSVGIRLVPFAEDRP